MRSGRGSASAAQAVQGRLLALAKADAVCGFGQRSILPKAVQVPGFGFSQSGPQLPPLGSVFRKENFRS